MQITKDASNPIEPKIFCSQSHNKFRKVEGKQLF